MPVFKIQSPDGRTITLEAPDAQTAMTGAQDYVSKNPLVAPSPPSPATLPAQTAPQASAASLPAPAGPSVAQASIQDMALPPINTSASYNPTLPQTPGALGNNPMAKGRPEGSFTAPGYTPSAIPALDPINSFANAAVDAIPFGIGPELTRAGNVVDSTVNNALGFPQESAEDRANIDARERAQFPAQSLAGTVTGNIAPLLAMGGTELGAAALGMRGPTLLRAAASGGTAYANQFLDNMARGQDPGQAASSAASTGPSIAGVTIPDPAIAAAIPFVGAGLGKVIQNATTSPQARLLAKALQRDSIHPDQIPAQLAALGPSATVADLGPNLQGAAASLATQPGEARDYLTEVLGERQAGANARIQGATNDLLGPATAPSQAAAGIQDQIDALSPQYQAVFRNKALSDNYAMDAGPIIDAIDQNIAGSVGNTATQLEKVRSMLLDPTTGMPTQDPGRIFAVRHELDGMIGAETNGTTAGSLKTLRMAIDQDLGGAVPGLKAVDAQRADLANQQKAYDFGQTLLGGGQNAVNPVDAQAQMGRTAIPSALGPIPTPSGVPGQVQEGLRASIDNIIGTNSNDRQALKKILTGEGSWNTQKLAAVFGPEKAAALTNLFSNESTLAGTENAALAGSRTIPLKSGQADLAKSSPGIIKSLLSFRPDNLYDAIKEGVMGETEEATRESTNTKLAKLLMEGSQLDPTTGAQIATINADPRKARLAMALLAQGLGPAMLPQPATAATGN